MPFIWLSGCWAEAVGTVTVIPKVGRTLFSSLLCHRGQARISGYYSVESGWLAHPASITAGKETFCRDSRYHCKKVGRSLLKRSKFVFVDSLLRHFEKRTQTKKADYSEAHKYI